MQCLTSMVKISVPWDRVYGGSFSSQGKLEPTEKFQNDCTKIERWSFGKISDLYDLLPLNGRIAEKRRMIALKGTSQLLFTWVVFEKCCFMEKNWAKIELYAHLFTILGETCVIFGAGPIGLLCLQAAITAGAARTIVVDIAEKRLEKARELGATLIINGKEENISQQIKIYTGGLGADVYLDAAGVQSAFTAGIASLRNGGRAILVAIFGKPVTLDAMDLVMREITIKGIVCYRHIFPEVIKLIDSKQMDVERLITRKIKLDDIVKDGFEALVSDPSEIKILIDIGSN